MQDLTTTAPRALAGEVVNRPGPGAVAQTEAQRAVAEVQAAMMIARANPRDQVAAIDRIKNACQRQGLAEVAVYSYARGGSDITGPSIRLAEALAQNWGNLQFGIRELEQRGGESTVQAFAWDVETNVKREMVFTVPHVRHTKRGSYKLDDPRDIYELVANNGARRLRSCILAVIPGDVVDDAVAECENTMRAKADTSPDAIQKLVAAFEAQGVTQQQLETRIQRRLDAIQPAQVVALRKIFTSMRDGMSSAADWFDPLPGEADEASATAGNEGAKAALKKATGKKPEPKLATDESGETHDTATGEVVNKGAEQPAATESENQPETSTDEQTGDVGSADSHPGKEIAEQLINAFSEAKNVPALVKVYQNATFDLAAMLDVHSKAVEDSYDRNLVRLGTDREKLAAVQKRQKEAAQ